MVPCTEVYCLQQLKTQKSIKSKTHTGLSEMRTSSTCHRLTIKKHCGLFCAMTKLVNLSLWRIRLYIPDVYNYGYLDWVAHN